MGIDINHASLLYSPRVKLHIPVVGKINGDTVQL